MIGELIRKILYSFFLIATGTLIATTLFISFFTPDAVLGVEILWQMLIIPLCTSLLIVIFYSPKELSKKSFLIRQVIHFILVMIILITCAFWFGWIETGNMLQLVTFILLVLINYTGVWFGCFVNDRKQASKLNEKIKAYQGHCGK